MRLKRNRVQEVYLQKRIVRKDKEGATEEIFGDALPFSAAVWPASGKVQAAMYGERLGYIYNLKVEEEYKIQVKNGQQCYLLQNGLEIAEKDGISLFSGKEGNPDYQVIAARPYGHLQLEVEKIVGRRTG